MRSPAWSLASASAVSLGWPATGFRAGPLLTTLIVLVATNGPMTVLRSLIHAPGRWSTGISDLLPHPGYAAVVTSTLDALEAQ